MRLWLLFLMVFFLVSPPVNYYQFLVDQDHLSGAPDFSFLNHPLSPSDRLFVRDGHFFRVGNDLTPQTTDDERVRLFGVNLAFGANFPVEADARRIAKRLRRLGVNLVRLHHMDSQPDSNPNNAGSILTIGPYPTLNPVAVARLRAFLEAFKAEGIYVDLNLHVGYQFRPSVDSLPALPNGVPMPDQSKPLNIFYPRMVELQKAFTRSVIDALQLNHDPVLAVVEINNESSLLQAWQTSGLDRTLLGDYKTELQHQWNSFLTTKYSTTEALRATWGGGEPDGLELIPNPAWRAEIHAPAQASYEITTTDGLPTLKAQITQGGAPAIFKQVGFSITTDRPYLASMEIRADLPDNTSRNIYWDIKQDVSPWRTETGRNIAVTNQWQPFAMAFQPQFAMDGIGRFAVSLENVLGTVYLRKWSLRQAARRGLSAGERLEDGSVSLVGENELATNERTNDYLRFLADRDQAYLREMLGAVREKAGPLVPVAGTQMGYGGLLNLDSHAEVDYQDNHFYVDHYGFPNVAWDSRDWYLRDLSSLGGGLTAFQSMAAAREAGRPYTVSEFNQPWPNTYAAEIDPTLAAFGAFQDWDAIMHFAYSHGRNWDDGVPNGFNINGDWTKFPNLGQAAWLFRSGAIEAGQVPIEIPVSQALRLQAGREKRNGGISPFLNSALGYNEANAFIHPIRIVKDETRLIPDLAKQAPAAPFVSDTGETTYDRTGQLFLIHSLKAAGVFGFAGTKKVTAGALDVELASTARGYAAMLLTSLDDQPIPDSKSLLLSMPGYTLRTQPGSDPPRPQQLVKYGNTTDWWTLEKEPNFPNKPSGNRDGGIGPVWMERVESYVTIRTAAKRLTVYPLDGAGVRMSPLPDQQIEKVDGGFRLHLQADGQPASPWYEVVADGITTAISVSAASYNGAKLATESMVAAFGAGLATDTQLATTIPLPTSLAGTRVLVKDSAGTERLAPLFFVSPNQVNYLIPSGTAAGAAMVAIASRDGTVSTKTVQIAAVAPGLFAANSNGQGVAAALVLRMKADGSQSYEPVAQFDSAQNKFVAVPIELGPEGDQVFLILFGTGIRFRSDLSKVTAKVGGADALVLYAGPQDSFVGLDQVNVVIPRSLVGRGGVDVSLTVEGKMANPVQVSIK